MTPAERTEFFACEPLHMRLTRAACGDRHRRLRGNNFLRVETSGECGKCAIGKEHAAGRLTDVQVVHVIAALSPHTPKPRLCVVCNGPMVGVRGRRATCSQACATQITEDHLRDPLSEMVAENIARGAARRNA
jgi:hypothetical protein